MFTANASGAVNINRCISTGCSMSTIVSRMTNERRQRLRIAALLGAACAVSTLLVFPYVAAMFPEMSRGKLPLPAIAVAQAVQAGVLGFLFSWAGLRLGLSLGLGAPLIQRRDGAPRDFAVVILIGLSTGALLVALDHWVFMPGQPAAIRELGAQLPRWKGFLASFYGGIAEEVQLRLFLMTLVAWVLVRIAGRRPAAFVAAVLLAALAFAAGHLPAAAHLTALTTPVVVRVFALNTIAGVVFGLIYWKRGLEHAMIAHFSADLVLHVLTS
jgi:hypothetical protein